MTKKQRFHYTLIVGALPLIIRCFIFFFFKEKDWDTFINPIDFVFLGLTLNITNINELNSLKENEQTKNAFREDNVWWSILTIIFLAVILGCLYLEGRIDKGVFDHCFLNITSIVLCCFSLIYSLYIIYSLNTIKKNDNS